MTIYAPLTRDLLNPSALAAVQLLMRQSVTPLSRTAFVRQLELLCEATAKHCSYSWLAQAAETTELSRMLPTYLTQKAIEIPDNAT